MIFFIDFKNLIINKILFSMKKLSCILAVVAATVYLVSCKSDALGGCDMEGNWKVKSVDMKSEKLDSSILGMSKNIALARKYSFTADSVVISDQGSISAKGTYSVDENDNLNMEGTGAAGALKENMKIVSCGGNEVTVSYRVPADTTVQALVVTTMVLEKEKK
jgi:hypothetical protein